MCGITASYSSPDLPIPTNLEHQLQSSILALNHRGPDSSGYYISEDGLVGLGHARLAIIDIDGGHQPISIGDVHAVVNGELYDYEDTRSRLESKGRLFQSHCDSELVVHLYAIYGERLLSHLRGEFSFVLYDSRRHILIASRDRFGIKPLYYSVSGGRLIIASEIKAFLAYGWSAEFDVESIAQMGDYFDNRTVFKGVYKLPAAHLLMYRRSGYMKIQRYWANDYPLASSIETRTIEEMITGLRELLVQSVRNRLRSDVPLAVYLSGGIDSAAIAGIVASILKEEQKGAKLTTFTLAFPGRKDLDEGPIAARMARWCGADTRLVTPSDEDLIAYFEKSVYHSEQPLTSLHGAGKAFLADAVRKKGYKVVLTGEGSDEILGGYSFLVSDYLRAVDHTSSGLRIPLPTADELELLRAKSSYSMAQDHYSLGRSVMECSSAAKMGCPSTQMSWAAMAPPLSIFNQQFLRDINVDSMRTISESVDLASRKKMNDGSWHPLHNGTYLASSIVLPNFIHNFLGERAEMSGTIEGRPPFLDHRLVEYINGLPPSVKVMPKLVVDESNTQGKQRQWSFTEKWILREAVRPFVTKEIYGRTKSQYNAPISSPRNKGSMELSPLQLFLKTRITHETVNKLGWANWNCIEHLLDEYLDGDEVPADGGLDKRARTLLFILSFIILQEKFSVPTVG